MPESAATVDEWSTGDYGWYGVFTAALAKADRFQKFSDSDREALAAVAAEAVLDVMSRPCDARYMPGPGRGQVWCRKHLGHPGPHLAMEV